MMCSQKSLLNVDKCMRRILLANHWLKLAEKKYLEQLLSEEDLGSKPLNEIGDQKNAWNNCCLKRILVANRWIILATRKMFGTTVV